MEVLGRIRTGHDPFLRDLGDGLPMWILFLGILDGEERSPSREEIDKLYEQLVEFVK